MPKRKKPIVYPTLFMVLITAVLMSILAVVNDFTKERIAEQDALKIQTSILKVVGFGEQLTDADVIRKIYSEHIVEKTLGGTDSYIAMKDGKAIAVAFPMSGNALWGSVNGYIALNASGDDLIGVDFISHSETPGLGGRIDESWFKDQFKALPIHADQPMTAKFKPANGGNVDAITGATLTSDAVLLMINEAASKYSIVLKEVQL